MTGYQEGMALDSCLSWVSNRSLERYPNKKIAKFLLYSYIGNEK